MQTRRGMFPRKRVAGMSVVAEVAYEICPRCHSISYLKYALSMVPYVTTHQYFSNDQIFAYMTPVDLLNLSRTSKPFRTLLISRESVPLWKASRKNVPGLPDCPPFLSEPAYANLCFDSHCHVCGSRGGKLHTLTKTALALS